MLADLLHAPDPYLSLGYSIVKSRRSANLTPSAVMFGGAGGTRTTDLGLIRTAL